MRTGDANGASRGATDLLVSGDIPGDVLYADGVLDREPMALALYASLVDDDAAVGLKT